MSATKQQKPAKNPRISVIVPVHNTEKYLRYCLDSIISQTYENLEIIIIDDGSSDNSGKIADEYAKQDKRIQVIHQKSRGVSFARNVGIKKATGEYVAFVDSDDYVAADFIEKLYLLAKENKADIATCQFESFTEEKLKLKKSPVWTQKVMTGRETVDQMLFRKHLMYLCLSLYKRSLFVDHAIKFPVGRTYEDIVVRLPLHYFASRVAFTKEKLYYYRARRDSITGRKFSKASFDDLLFAVESVRDFCNAHKEISPAKVNYFDFRMSLLILNYLAEEKLLDRSLNKYWTIIVKRLRGLMGRHIEFPSMSARIICLAFFIMAHSRSVYTIFYRLRKGMA
jgi:glycosyltransferase involved in cell wall biosynthesis